MHNIVYHLFSIVILHCLLNVACAWHTLSTLTQHVNHRTRSRGSITPAPPPLVTHIFTEKPTNQKPQHSASTCRAPTGKKRELVLQLNHNTRLWLSTFHFIYSNEHLSECFIPIQENITWRAWERLRKNNQNDLGVFTEPKNVYIY